MRAAHSRRDLIGLAGLTGACGSILLAACDGDDEGPGGRAADGAMADLTILNSALGLEHATVAAYLSGMPLLEGEQLAVVRQLLEHERDHARRLSRTIEDLGGVPAEPRPDEEYARRFPTLTRPSDALRFAVDLENMAIRTYTKALTKLRSADLRQLTAAILTTEAEHASVLLGELGREQTPSAFVTGTPRVS